MVKLLIMPLEIKNIKNNHSTFKEFLVKAVHDLAHGVVHTVGGFFRNLFGQIEKRDVSDDKALTAREEVI